FFRLNVKGLHESSDKAVKIMWATTIMAVIMLVWCGITLIVRRDSIHLPSPLPDLSKKVQFQEVVGVDRFTGEQRSMWARDRATGALIPARDENDNIVPRINKVTGEQEDPLGFIGRFFPDFANRIRQPGSWFSIIGVIGLLLAFGHSVLAMSGE